MVIKGVPKSLNDRLGSALLCLTLQYTPKEPYNNDQFSQRKGPKVINKSPTGETSWAVCATWCKHENSYLYAYAGDAFNNLEDALRRCYYNEDCGGVTQVYSHYWQSRDHLNYQYN